MIGAANDGARNASGFNACTPAGMFNVRATSNAINDDSSEEDAVIRGVPLVLATAENDIPLLRALTVMRAEIISCKAVINNLPLIRVNS